jgi:hypothetical protein
MKTVKKYQAGGKAADKTATKKPRVNTTPQSSKRYLEAFEKPTKQDSLEYERGFGEGTRRKGSSIFAPLARHAGNMEGADYKKPFKKVAMKSGGKVTKKGGMKAFEKTAFDKKADKPGGRHGKENSAKDKKMDKIDAKKQGFIKRGGGSTRKK